MPQGVQTGPGLEPDWSTKLGKTRPGRFGNLLVNEGGGHIMVHAVRPLRDLHDSFSHSEELLLFLSHVLFLFLDFHGGGKSGTSSKASATCLSSVTTGIGAGILEGVGIYGASTAIPNVGIPSLIPRPG